MDLTPQTTTILPPGNYTFDIGIGVLVNGTEEVIDQGDYSHLLPAFI